MICFEVCVNGQKTCVAGVGESGVLTACVTWLGRQEAATGESILQVGGLAGKEHVFWTDIEHLLQVGDEVTFKIVEAEAADEPIRRRLQKEE